MTEKEIRQFKRELKKLDKQVEESNKRFDYHFNRIMQML